MEDIYKTRKTLLKKIQDQNDDQSWEEFISIYRKYIFAVIRGMEIPKHDAGDILQEVILRLWNRIPEMDPTEIRRFRSYLSTVTRSCIMDFLRKKMRHKTKVERAKDNDLYSHLEKVKLPEIDEIATREWENYLSNMALKNISASFSGNAIDVFRLSIEGKSVEEIAKELSIQEQSVYRLKSRVKAKLIEEVARLRDRLE